jgi:SAM-dependent methyltransferase
MDVTLIRVDNFCRICGNSNVVTVIKLAPTPLEDQFVPFSRRHIKQETYPLDLTLCKICGYLYLPHIVNPEVSYRNYIYQTTVTLGLSQYYDNIAKGIMETYNFPESPLSVDIGSNDGAMLTAFRKVGSRVQGVEPSTNQAQITNEAELPTINGFFDRNARQKIIESQGLAHVVTANYVFANIDDLHEFVENVRGLLQPDGIFVVQTGYHLEQMKVNMFDYIYHEHFSYFSIATLDYLFQLHGLEMIDAQKSLFKGGSIIITAQLKNGKRPISKRLRELRSAEEHADLKGEWIYKELFRRIEKVKRETHALLKGIQAEGKKVVGYGASHSTTTFTYFFECEKFIDYIVDDNPKKDGMLSPGHHIPVFSSSKIYENSTKFILILAWQYSDAILRRHKAFLEKGGSFIIPLPSLRVVNKDHYE